MDAELRRIIVGAGVVLLAAGLVGGAVKIAGNELPAINQPAIRVACSGLGVLLIVLGLLSRRPRNRTYYVTQPTSSISVPKGTLSAPRYETTRFGGGTREVVAADYYRAADGSYVFTDARGANVRELPAHEVDSILAHGSCERLERRSARRGST